MMSRFFTALALGIGLFLVCFIAPSAWATPPINPLPTPLIVDCIGGVGNAADLIDKIHTANASGGAEMLILGANCVYTLTGPADTITNTFGRTGLPAVTGTLAISGQGATIQRALTAANSFDDSFRLLYVGPTGDLTLHNLTLRNGLAQGGDGAPVTGGAAGMGGAIFNQGHLALDQVTLRDNVAQGGNGVNATSYTIGGGGGVGGPGYQGNGNRGGGPNGGQNHDYGSGDPGGLGGGGGGMGGNGGLGGGGGMAFGGAAGNGGFGGGGGGALSGSGGNGGFGGGSGYSWPGFAASGGGGGLGGAIFNLHGTLYLTDTIVDNNRARGGQPSYLLGPDSGGTGLGGGLFNLNGQVVILSSTITNNVLVQGTGAISTPAGGGIYSLGDGQLFEDGGKSTRIGGSASLTMHNSTVDATPNGYTDCVVNSKDGGVSVTHGGNNSIGNNAGCAVVEQKEPEMIYLPIILR